MNEPDYSQLLECLERAHHLLGFTQYAGGLSYIEIGRVIAAARALSPARDDNELRRAEED